jgi:uncharacterized phage infection (PIP) family protein YhgE
MEDETEVTDVEVTRARIEQTRSEMSDTLDAIKAKLEPQTLMQQAKETVSEVTATAAQKAKETVADVTQRAKETVHDVTADVVQQAKEALPTVTANAVSGAVTEAKEAVGSAVHTAKEAVGDAVDTATVAVSGAVDHAKDATSVLAETIRRHPVPAALIGIGLGWLWIRSRQHSATETWHYRSNGSRYPASSSEESWSGSTTATTQRYGRVYEADSMGGDATDSTARRAQAKVGEVAGQVQEKAGQLVHQVQDKAGQLASQVQEKAGQVAHQVGDLGNQARQQMRQTGDWFQQTLYTNPLAIGAVALGLGAAIGLLLPETEAENRWMGETRDRLADKAQEAAHDLKLKAQIVAEEAMDTVAEEARNQGLTPPAASGETASPRAGARTG